MEESVKNNTTEGEEENNNHHQSDLLEAIESCEEQHRFALLRTFVRTREPLFKEEEERIDDWTLRRFLRARDLEVEKAGVMLCKYLNWRRSFAPKGYISETEIPNEMAQNKMFLQGYDRKGRPITLVLAARHFYQKHGGVDEFKRFVVYGIDKICARIPVGHDKFVAIGDLQGWGYSNSDIRGYLASLSILQDCYPERLGKLFIVHAPKIFMTVWKMVYPFIDRNTRSKIVFVENKSLKSTLLQDIDEEQLPEIYGGKLPLVPIHEC